MARVPAADVVAALVAKGVPEHVAQGVVWNFQDESGLDTGIQEIAPNSGRGGYGLAQWTGSRRIALEDFAKSQGKPVNDLGMQLDFFMQENAGPEAAAWKKVMYAPTAQDAAVAFVNSWERPATKYAEQRSAKYAGMPSGPGEGGKGVLHPLNPQVGTGGYVAPGAPTTQPGATPPPAGGKDKYGKAIGGALGSMAGAGAPVLGEGGNAPQVQAYAPPPANSMAIVSEGGGADYRNSLALLMQRLNSGRLA